MFYLPILIVIATTATYHLCSKSMSKHINPFLNLLIVYIVAALSSFIYFMLTNQGEGIISSLGNINYAVPMLALSIVGLEFGFILLYRTGWDISLGPLVNGIIVAVILVIVGLLAFNEVLGINKVIGISLCLIGLVMLNYQPKCKTK
ncbi:MAG: hypothetical protein GX078_05860 [Clostridiales bacterium]|nr:hypothetical protein [Clostridiales bacterium]